MRDATPLLYGFALGLAVVFLIALGWYTVLDYGHEELPQYNPGIEIDIDRAKPRPTMKPSQAPKKAAPTKRT